MKLKAKKTKGRKERLKGRGKLKSKQEGKEEKFKKGKKGNE